MYPPMDRANSSDIYAGDHGNRVADRFQHNVLLSFARTLKFRENQPVRYAALCCRSRYTLSQTPIWVCQVPWP